MARIYLQNNTNTFANVLTSLQPLSSYMGQVVAIEVLRGTFQFSSAGHL